MSASLLVFVPVALLAIVLSLCFIGCDEVFGLDNIRTARNYTPTILDEPTLLAYWILGEAAGATTAADLTGSHDGAYQSQSFPDDPAGQSAAAPGLLSLGISGIVIGATVPPHDEDAPRATCIDVDGGYVDVPFAPELNPSKADGFSLEAWVRPEWDPNAPPAVRAIIEAISTTAGVTGFALIANQDNIWQAVVGSGAVGAVANGPEVMFAATAHLVMTYDGSLLRLFLNGTEVTAMPVDYAPNADARLLIGAGAGFLPEPRNPWVGKIQCVAIYKGALPLETVIKHFHIGNGVAVP